MSAAKYFEFDKEYDFEHPVFWKRYAAGTVLKVRTIDEKEYVCDGSVSVFELNSNAAKEHGKVVLRPW